MERLYALAGRRVRRRRPLRKQAEDGGSRELSTNETRPEVTTFRLSPQQEQQWATSAGAPGVVQAAIELPGSLVPDEIREALSRLVERHEILRTTFVRQAGMRTPGQFVHDKLEPVWHLDTSAA